MIRVILNTFRLLTLILALGFLSANQVLHAQQSTTALTGEWVGNSEPAGRVEFLHFSLTENTGELVSPLKAKLTLVQLEGSRVRIELSSLKLVMTGTLAGDVPEKTCSPCAQTLVLFYADFGPPSMSYELRIGDAWNQWKNEGHELPDDVDIRVVVYRGIELAEVQKQFPVVRGKSDYRYLEYTRTVRFLQENVKLLESYKRAAEDANEIAMWDGLAQSLKKTHERIIESLGGNSGI